MLKKAKFLAVAAIAVLSAFVVAAGIPSEVYAQTDTEGTYEWDSTDWDWEDSDYDFSDTDWTTEYDYGYGSSELTPEEEAAIRKAAIGVATVVLIPTLIVSLAMYVFMAIALMKIGEKVGVDAGKKWMAWIPIANYFYMAECAGLEWWHALIALFFPFWLIYVMMKIAERRGFSMWTGCLLLVPIANLIFIGYLAWGEPKQSA
ncbi:hypothetical protein GF357_04925 [Candidatus Dojkabacteria bacterium]|nr:hypothetical protein [Candidatus Dojkabacteria bacterium]